VVAKAASYGYRPRLVPHVAAQVPEVAEKGRVESGDDLVAAQALCQLSQVSSSKFVVAFEIGDRMMVFEDGNGWGLPRPVQVNCGA
jgi:hypothetical protein